MFRTYDEIRRVLPGLMSVETRILPWWSIGIVGIMALYIVFGSQPETELEQPFRYSGFLMDSIANITAYGPRPVASAAVDAALAAMRRLDDAASFHRPDSALARLNRDRKIVPDAILAPILRASSEAAVISEGYCDPTFAVLHRSYGFYDGHGRLPPDSEIAADLALIGWSRMTSEFEQTFHLASGALIDLGGIGGGFALQMAADAMRAASCTTFFIDDGGDLWMEGSKPDKTPWRIAVRDPRSDERSLAMIETYEPLAVSTSGDYERFVEVDGRRYGHIMDPHTGRSAAWYRSVTVLASDPVTAEIQGLTLFAMPPAEGRNFADKYRIPALFLPASGPVWLTAAGENRFSEISQ
ncbi:MAG: FAD:protein FMN transferase [Candidatus Riflebacteria bacterium]|nr:FAD:protein FMN transferase [Candidatus Riflebacteria bacterium]